MHPLQLLKLILIFTFTFAQFLFKDTVFLEGKIIDHILGNYESEKSSDLLVLSLALD